MKKNISTLVFLFGSIALLGNAQSSVSSSIASNDHRCCSAPFTITDSDGLPSTYRVFKCAQILGNSPTASEDAKADACEYAEAAAAFLQASL